MSFTEMSQILNPYLGKGDLGDNSVLDWIILVDKISNNSTLISLLIVSWDKEFNTNSKPSFKSLLPIRFCA